MNSDEIQDTELVDIVETDYFAASADPSDETISVAFFERNLIMEFQYEEIVELGEVIDQIRAYIEKQGPAKG